MPNADCFYTEDEVEIYHNHSANTYAFWWDDIAGKLRISCPAGTHMTSWRMKYDKEVKKPVRSETTNNGRIWLDYNVISFWYEPKTEKRWHDILTALERELDIDNIMSFKIKNRSYGYNLGDYPYVKDYANIKFDPSNEKRLREHEQSPMEKIKRVVPKGMGSRKLPNGMEWHPILAVGTIDTTIALPNKIIQPRHKFSNDRKVNSIAEFRHKTTVGG